MLKRILKSWKFWLIILVLATAAYLYFSGTLPRWINQLRIRFSKDRTFDEALQDQSTKDWDYLTDPVTANVIGSDLEAGTLVLSFVYPPGFLDARFGDERPVPDLTAKITCPKEESILTATRVPKDLKNPEPLDTELLESEIDIVKTAISSIISIIKAVPVLSMKQIILRYLLSYIKITQILLILPQRFVTNYRWTARSLLRCTIYSVREWPHLLMRFRRQGIE